jgi:hypothetical protein
MATLPIPKRTTNIRMLHEVYQNQYEEQQLRQAQNIKKVNDRFYYSQIKTKECQKEKQITELPAVAI